MTVREQLVLLALAAAVGAGAVALYLYRSPAPPGTDMPADSPPAVKWTIEEKAEAPPIEEIPLPAILPESTVPAPSSKQAQTVTVSVGGAINQPGVYVFAKTARVADLLAKAGGACENADLNDINLAAPLLDGTTLSVPEGATAALQGETLVVRGRKATAGRNPDAYTLSGWMPQPDSARSPAAGEATPTAPHATAALKAGTPDARDPKKAGDSTTGLLDLNQATAAELEALPGIGPKLAGQIVQYREGHPFQTVDDITNVSGIGPKRLEAIRPFVAVSRAR